MTTEFLPRPSLDHYIGQIVDSVEEADESMHWDIVLESGVRIRNTDGRRTMPTDIEGKSFLLTALSETETKLVFGITRNGVIEERTDLRLTPALYQIVDSRYGQAISPQRRDPEEDQMIAQKFNVPLSEVEPVQPTEPLPDADALEAAGRHSAEQMRQARQQAAEGEAEGEVESDPSQDDSEA